MDVAAKSTGSQDGAAVLRRLLASLEAWTGVVVACDAICLDGATFAMAGLRVADLPPRDIEGRLTQDAVTFDLSPLLATQGKPAISLSVAHNDGSIETQGPIAVEWRSHPGDDTHGLSVSITGAGQTGLEAKWAYGALEGSVQIRHGAAEPLTLLRRLGDAALEMALIGNGWSAQDWLKVLEAVAAPAEPMDED